MYLTQSNFSFQATGQASLKRNGSMMQQSPSNTNMPDASFLRSLNHSPSSGGSPYPNQWKEHQNLKKLHSQIKNISQFLPEDIVHTNIQNKKYLEIVKKVI